MLRPLAALFALALVLRLAVVLLSPGFAPLHDAADYDRVAAGVAATGAFPPTRLGTPGTPAALRPPAWPLALAASYELTGARWTAGRVLGAVLGTGAVALLALIALRLWGRRAALAAAGIAAVAPPLIVTNASLLSEGLFIVLLLGALAATLRASDDVRWCLAAGALVAAATLTRPVGLLVMPLLAVAVWPRARLRGVAALVVAAAVVLAPWTVRNAVVFDEPAPLGTLGGYTSAGTWNPTALAAGSPYTGAWQVPKGLPEYAALVDPPVGDESVVAARLGAQARAFALDHPGYVLRTTLTNALRINNLAGHDWATRLAHEEMGVPERFDGVLIVSRWLLLFGGLAGLLSLVRRRRAGPWWLWAVPALLLLTTLPLLGSPRYGMATDPFLVLALAGAIGYGSSVPNRNER